jgi:hypothetical protein
MLPYLIAGAIGFVVGKLFEEDEAPKYADGGEVLLAPNGQPSNLTPEQYKLVRTPAFKKWFGDWENNPETASKVIDEETKEPLVVWHGSKSKENFNIFKQSSRFEFIYFAKNKYYSWLHFTQDTIDNPFQLKPFFLNIRNLLNAEEFGFENIDYPDLKSFFYGIHDLDNDTQISKSYLRFWQVLRYSNDLFHSLKKQDYYDGISFYENMYESTTWKNTDDFSLSYVVMNPNQIKLADGTNTKFDGNNPDIRFDEGGIVSNYREFYDNLQVEDGSKYIGQKFANVFPFIAKKTPPAQIRISVKEYNNLLGRLENDNYTTKGMKTADLNRFEKRKKYIDKKKYLSRFYLDPSGTIIGFDNSDND